MWDFDLKEVSPTAVILVSHLASVRRRKKRSLPVLAMTYECVCFTEVELDPNRTWCPEVGCETICHVCSGDKSKTKPVKCPTVSQMHFLSAAVAVWYWFAPVSASIRLGQTKPPFYPCSSDHRLESQWAQIPLGVLYMLHMVSFFSSALMMKKWHMKLQ